MKHLRVTARVDPAEAPTFFNLLANTPEVDEARVLEVNTTVDGIEIVPFAIDGDPTVFADQAAETPGVESVEVSRTDSGQAYALLVMQPLETPLFEAIHRASPLAGFVIRTPMIYRDGAMYGHVVGDPEPLQQALNEAPDAIDVQIDEITEFQGWLDNPESTLSGRQREAVEVALNMGYYEQPRGATHTEIATELDCAPPTASDHLQKAEAKLVDTVIDEFGPDI